MHSYLDLEQVIFVKIFEIVLLTHSISDVKKMSKSLIFKFLQMCLKQIYIIIDLVSTGICLIALYESSRCTIVSYI